jgi:hypothetical protein
MYYNSTLIVIVLVLLFLFWLHNFGKLRTEPKQEIPEAKQEIQQSKKEEPKPGLTTGQDFLPDEDGPTDEDTGNKYYDLYKEIPRETGCNDEYKGCKAWADNGECEANPDFMLQNCPNSCRACGLNQEQKGNLVRYYLNEPLKKCIYRAEPYPPGIRLTVAIKDLYG